METTKLTLEQENQLDDLVEEWHDLPEDDARHGESLRRYLGMTGGQYRAFVENRDLPGCYVPPPLRRRTPEVGVDISKAIGQPPTKAASAGMLLAALAAVACLLYLFQVFMEVR